MKLKRSSNYSSNQGSVLLVAIGTVIVLGIILAAILSLITQERRILTRTAAWNTALPVAEAGIEEAMSHLRQVDGGPRGVNGWQPQGSSFTRSRYLTDGRYSVGFDSAAAPVIISTGEVFCTNANRWIQRRVQVTTSLTSTFNHALVARKNISASGQFSSDSFDSTIPALNTDGKYDPTKRNDKGDVAANSSEPGAITLSGQVKIYGSVNTGPTGTVAVANNSSIGSETWIDGGQTGIEADHSSADMNVSFPAATSPVTNGVTPKAGFGPDGKNYKYILQDGIDYQMSTLDVGTGGNMYVSGKARLLVDKDVKASGSGAIVLGTNSSLEVYVKKGDISLSGQGAFNPSGNAANFSVIGLSGVTQVSITGNGTFTGTIYAPTAELKLAGGGNDVLDFIGAAVVDSVSARGHFKFHYDEALAKNKPKNLVITSWVEL